VRERWRNARLGNDTDDDTDDDTNMDEEVPMTTTTTAFTKRSAAGAHSRRSLLKGAAAGLGATALTGTSWAATRGMPAIQAAPIELTYWHGWTEQWEEMVQFVVDQFHAKQDRIRVTPVVVPVGTPEQASEFLAKLTGAIAAGNPPDIVTLFGSTAIPTLAAEEALVALDDIEGSDLPAVQAWMDPNVYTLGQFQDRTYGLSYWAGCYCVLTNSDLLEAAGLDPNAGPRTIAELDEMAAQLTVRRDNGQIDRMGFLPSPSNFELWATVFGGSMFDPETNTVTANDPKIVEALAWYRSYADTYGADEVAAFREGLASERGGALDPFLAARFAMQDQGPWKLGDIKKFGEAEFRYGVVPPPRAGEEPQANWTWGDIQVIPRGSKDPAAAAEFVKFTAGVNDPEGYAERVVWGNRPINVPVSRQVLEVPSFQQVVAEYPGFQTYIDSLLNAGRVGSPPVMPAAAYLDDRLVATVESVMLLQNEPQAALDELTADVQAELESY
jgi:multiple sugar transport system substrate-binding protein